MPAVQQTSIHPVNLFLFEQVDPTLGAPYNGGPSSKGQMYYVVAFNMIFHRAKSKLWHLYIASRSAQSVDYSAFRIPSVWHCITLTLQGFKSVRIS